MNTTFEWWEEMNGDTTIQDVLVQLSEDVKQYIAERTINFQQWDE